MTDIRLIDFIPDYPSPTDPDVAKRLSQVKQLYDLRLPPSEPPPSASGEALRHQQYMARIFSDESSFREGVMVHGMGTGKTCLMSAMIELERQSRQRRGMTFRPALILVQNEDLVRRFQAEVTNVCTDRVYEATEVSEKERREGMSEQKSTIRRNVNLRTTYDVQTIESFANRVLSKLGPEALKREFDHRDVFIDEAHAVSSVAKGDKKEKRTQDLAGVRSRTFGSLYEAIHSFLHTIEGGRKILLTGTPVWDTVGEFGELMNLILPLEGQLPIGTEFERTYFDDAGKLVLKGEMGERLSRAIERYVSVVNTTRADSGRRDVGMREPWSEHITVYPDVMSEFQAKIARKEQKNKKNVYRAAQNASTLVFPKGSSEDVEDAFERQVVSTYQQKSTRRSKKTGAVSSKTVTRTKYAFKDPEVKRELTTNLRNYSANFHSTIAEIERHPREIVQVFNDFVTGSGGVIDFALLLEARGFKWVRKPEDVNGPGRRFIAVTSDEETTENSKQIERLVDILNSKENAYADLIQVIVGSNKVALGHTFKNVRQQHITRPYWNFSRTDQASARSVDRVGSQNDLKPEERYIRVFFHLSVYPARKGEKGVKITVGEYKGERASLEPTIDAYVLEAAQQKDFKTAQLLRLMRIKSFDCALAYERNTQGKPGSRECAYGACDYTCSGFTPDEMKRFLKHGWRLGELTDAGQAEYIALSKRREFERRIVELLKEHGGARLDELYRLTAQSPDSEPKGRVGRSSPDHYTLLAVLERMVEERTPVKDAYGFVMHIKEDRDFYYLDWDYSLEGNLFSYIDAVPLEQTRPLAELITALESSGTNIDAVQAFCAKPDSATLDAIPYASQVIMFETAVTFIVEKLHKNPVKKTGMKQIDVLLSKFRGELYEIDGGVWVHNLQAAQSRGMAHNVSKKKVVATGTLRVFDPKKKRIDGKPSASSGSARASAASLTSQGRWLTASRSDEDTYLQAVNAAKDEEIKRMFKRLHTTVVLAYYRSDDTYRIIVKGKKGLAVKNHTNAQFLDLFMNRLKEFPPYDTARSKDGSRLADLSKRELAGEIRERTEKTGKVSVGLGKAIGDVDALDKRTLIDILGVLKAGKKNLERWTISMFKSRGLSVTR